MLNTTAITNFVNETELESAAYALVNGSLTIGITTALVLLAVGAVWLISKTIKFPLSDVFVMARDLAKEKIKQYKDSEKKPEPFCLSILGLTIKAHGIRGKIMFIALLGSMAALAETIIPDDPSLGGLFNP